MRKEWSKRDEMEELKKGERGGDWLWRRGMFREPRASKPTHFHSGPKILICSSTATCKQRHTDELKCNLKLGFLNRSTDSRNP